MTRIIDHKKGLETNPAHYVGVSVFSISYTAACNVQCSHCVGNYGPHRRERMPLSTAIGVAKDAAEVGFRTLWVTGGEPMLYPREIVELVRHASAAGLYTVVGSNGFWGRDRKVCDELVLALKRAGLTMFSISADQFHEEQIPLTSVMNVAKASLSHGLDLQIAITTARDDHAARRIEALFADIGVQVLTQDLSAFGRARRLDPRLFPDLSHTHRRACILAWVPNITATGRVWACCGPHEEAAWTNPLWVGSVHEDTLGTIMARQAGDPLLRAIKVCGGCHLIDLLFPGHECGPANGPDTEGACAKCIPFWSDPEHVRRARQLLEKEREDIRRGVTTKEIVFHHRASRIGRQRRGMIPIEYELFPLRPRFLRGPAAA